MVGTGENQGLELEKIVKAKPISLRLKKGLKRNVTTVGFSTLAGLGLGLIIGSFSTKDQPTLPWRG